jgi:hypothetical protein
MNESKGSDFSRGKRSKKPQRPPSSTAKEDARIEPPSGKAEETNMGQRENKINMSGDLTIMMAPARLSAASKTLGICWFVVANLISSEELYICCTLGVLGIVWGIWEIFWTRRWKSQQAKAKEILRR